MPQPSPLKQALAQRLPFLHWPRPTWALLRSEAFAGLSVGLMVVPQGVAYAALAGMPLITGIYASLWPSLVAVLLSASTRLSVGPTALSAMLVAASLSGLAQPGSAQWVHLAVWLSLLSGLLQTALGFARFGWLLNLVSSPVLTAFTQGAALLILASQLPALLGWPGQGLTALWGAGVGEHAALAGQLWAALDGPSLALGLGALALLLLSKRWKPTFPVVLVVVAGAAALSQGLDLAAHGTPLVGALPQGLPTLYLPQALHWDELKQLLLPTLVITLVSFLETASSAKVDSERKGQRWDQDQDLIGQGMGKLASGLCGAFATSASFSRSALNLYAGAQTGWASVVAVGVIVLMLLFFTPWLQAVPQSVLAAIVVAAVLGLFRPRVFVRLLAINRAEGSIAVLTFAITLAAAPRLYWGVLAGVVMGLAYFLHARLHPRIIEVGLHPDGSLRDRHLWKLPPLASRLYALRMDAELDFAAASGFERAIAEHLDKHPQVRHVCLFAQPINRIDLTGVETFVQVCQRLRQQGITLHISGIKLPVERALLKAQALPEASDWLRLYRTDADTLQALRALDAQASSSSRDFGLDQQGQQLQRLLPAQAAGLGRNRRGDA